jgi:oxygen-independent coproporphyrinogen-3 oxidase
LAQLLDSLREKLRIDRTELEVEEFTVEANPATLDDWKAELLAKAGVTRVSMGAQSFNTEELAILGRRHTPADIAPSVDMLRRHGIRQISLDLMFGIPGQTRASWAHSLGRAIEVDPDHVACYGLTFEPGTQLAALKEAGTVRPCSESLEALLYLTAIDRLGEAGYEHYETSNFARPGCRCRHNLIYWNNDPYLGVGPSAVGCVEGRRYRNIADVDRYIHLMDAFGLAEAESEEVSPSMLVTEMILMRLRLIEGMSIEVFRKRTGRDAIEVFGETLERLAEMDLLTVSETHIALTRQGRLLSDSVMAELVAATD